MVDQNEIHRMARSNDVEKRKKAVKELKNDFAILKDKKQAWSDLHLLTEDKIYYVRWDAASAIGSVFSYIPDKEQGWNDLMRLTQDIDRHVRWGASSALGMAFSNFYDKKKGWDDLHRLTQNKDINVRAGAASSLGMAFSHIPDKEQSWNDLHRLTQDNDDSIRWEATSALGMAFSHISDKKKGWNDLHRLTQDNDDSVRWVSIRALSMAFSHIPDKKQGWDDLIRLTQDNDNSVRRDATSALGSAFSHMLEKKQAWENLQWLTLDNDNDVRASAYHSMGKASIFKAANAENDFDFKKEMEEAIRYFEKSSEQGTYSNPAKFCLPFYRSFYTLTFKKGETETEVQKYLSEAKRAVEGSQNKEKLLEAVENLGNALKEAQKVRDFDTVKSDLNAYRRYCERAAEMLDEVENKVPGATRLVRKGLPIIDERIKGIRSDIQEKTKALCRKTKGTPLEELGSETVISARELATSDIKMYQVLEKIGKKLNKFCEYLPDDKKKSICEKIQGAKNLDILAQAETIDEGFDYMLLHFPIPQITSVHVEERQKDIIRIATIQFNFELTEFFPPTLIKKEECKKKIILALETAKSLGADTVCLPELCMCEEWIQDLKQAYPQMIIIAGSYYKNDFNECPVIMNKEVPCQSKKSPSFFEDPEITGSGMKSGEKIFRYSTRYGTFSVLICRDFLNYARFCDHIDIIFCPSFNDIKGIERFHEFASTNVTNTPSYILISNTALHGGTSIFGQLHRNYFKHLIKNGCKKKDEDSYKLCELEKGFEGLIIADFDLVHKSPQLQTPGDPNKVIKSVKNIRKIKFS